MLERTYWPFPIRKADLSEYDKEVIAFSETAYAEGFVHTTRCPPPTAPATKPAARSS